MAEYVWTVYEGYRDLMDNKSDPRVNNWPMMSGPFPTLAVCLFYVYFVKVLGPKLMENRKPFNLRRVMIWYNFAQVLFSTWLFYEALVSGWWRDYSFRCQPVDYSTNPKAMRMTRGCWWYYFSKYTEFMDTIFFVLRKKQDHVSTLHVIHHGCMPMSVWVGLKFTPGGHGSFFGLLNTFVHIIMYSYYFLAALGPKVQPYLWWKRYLTTLQMVQFVVILIHASQLLFIECDYPKAFAWWIGLHAVMFFFLFRTFYDQAYKTGENGGATSFGKEQHKAISHEKYTNHTHQEEEKERRIRSRSHLRPEEGQEKCNLPENDALTNHGMLYANQYKMATGYISDSGLRNRVFIDNQTLKE